MKQTAILAIALGLGWASAQPFQSGSDGSDGALIMTDSGTFDFDPAAFNPPLDTNGDNIFNFTTIRIGPKTRIRLTARYFNGPVYWLASGDVLIQGVVDLNGEPGGSCPVGPGWGPAMTDRRPTLPGAGGFPGGIGGTCQAPPQPGGGPGGAIGPGGHAGHSNPGSVGNGGKAYGNRYLVPLHGGSGGAGANYTYGIGNCRISDLAGGTGGAGGGAILIASSGTVQVNGVIEAYGNDGACGAGSASGGAIKIVANTIGTTGQRPDFVLNVWGRQSYGWIRLEAFNFLGGMAQSPDSWTSFFSKSPPMGLFLPSGKPPSIRVLRIAGIQLPDHPNGDFLVPDAVINTGGSVSVDVVTSQIPVGTIPKLVVYSVDGPDQLIELPPTTGLLKNASASVNVLFPPGYSRGYVTANWSE